jgi:hypothetical protein
MQINFQAMKTTQMSRKQMLKQSVLAAVGFGPAGTSLATTPAKGRYPKNYPLPLMVTDASQDACSIT